ncbi:MAG: MMPL family transporter [Actinomycetota bacterium]|nr:MMPL family transporter [Actinomycetota bacterium]
MTSRIEDLAEADGRISGTELHVAGLPLAQDAFGAQMFLQMGLFAPLAGALIFLAMWVFFRRLSLVVPAMVVAMLTVISTMGLLIGTGNTVHFMSSMIAIFLMPTAILDSVHVLSEFFDRYPITKDRRATIEEIYHELAGPLLFTTLTTIVGFASLALAPIPPVRVFGIFVAVGMALAWLFTVLFVPAYLMALDGEKLERHFASREVDGPLAHFVRAVGRLPLRRPAMVLVALFAVGVLAVVAIPRIEVNDNPVRWFKSDHEVRVATEALNAALPGTFGANIVLTADDPADLTSAETLASISGLETAWAASPQVGSAATVVDLTQGLTGPDAAGSLSDARAGNSLVGSLVTEDQRTMNLRLFLNDGDNQSMQAVIDATAAQLEAQPFPAAVSWQWGGETYLNLVWQNEMVDGMLTAFLSTLGVVLLLLTVLFRSVRWALLAMLPVAWTVLLVYGLLGWVGKDYDMPIAVLSTLVIGIGIDFAIHFVERQREEREQQPDHHTALVAFFEEPARALTRNAASVAIGFTPLFLSSLTPYIVVGVFLSSILIVSWLVTLLGLPAFLRVGELIEKRTAARKE